jgi:hypothetical protein
MACFDVLAQPLYNQCWCPCSRHAAEFRQQFDVNIHEDEQCLAKGRFAPKALVAHLRSKISDKYHELTLIYLQHLYANYLRVDDITMMHNAFFYLGDANDKKYEQLRAKQLRQYVPSMRFEIGSYATFTCCVLNHLIVLICFWG